MFFAGHSEAQRRKRMGSDWMKHDKAFDEAGHGSYFTHLGAACRAFAEYPGIWFFCGGTALDLFLGRPIRTRHDIDIGVLRDEQDLLPQHFPGVRITYVNPGSPAKTAWKGAPIILPVHELYLELPGAHLELLLNEATDSHWVYRRDTRITRELSRAVLNTEQGIPYLAPEIVLLYKSKHMRDRDIVDFNAAISALHPEQKSWLQTALDTVYLDSHPWSQKQA